MYSEPLCVVPPNVPLPSYVEFPRARELQIRANNARAPKRTQRFYGTNPTFCVPRTPVCAIAPGASNETGQGTRVADPGPARPERSTGLVEQQALGARGYGSGERRTLNRCQPRCSSAAEVSQENISTRCAHQPPDRSATQSRQAGCTFPLEQQRLLRTLADGGGQAEPSRAAAMLEEIEECQKGALGRDSAPRD
jgi:hypothetical protein